MSEAIATRARQKRKVNEMIQEGSDDAGGKRRGPRVTSNGIASRNNNSRECASTSSDEPRMSRQDTNDLAEFQPHDEEKASQELALGKPPGRKGRGTASRQKKAATTTVTLENQDASLDERLQVLTDSKAAITKLLAAMNGIDGKPKENHDANHDREIQKLNKNINKLDTRLMETKKELVGLRKKSSKDDKQLASMGKIVAQATRTSTGTADDVLQGEMSRLFHAARHWAFNVADNTPLDAACKDIALDKLVHSWKVPYAIHFGYSQIPRTTLFQAMVGAFLRNILNFKAQFSGILELARFFSNQFAHEMDLNRTETTESYPADLLTEFKKWQSKTFGLLGAIPSEKKEVNLIGSTLMVLESCEDLISEFIPAFSVQNSLGLDNITADGIKFARDIATQPARYTFFEPRVDSIDGARFDPESMQDQFGQSLQSEEGKPVVMCLHPGLRKQGNDQGENMHIVTTISKAMVFCLDVANTRERPEGKQKADGKTERDGLSNGRSVAPAESPEEASLSDVDGDGTKENRPIPVVVIHQ